MHKKPTTLDLFCLSAFVILITLQPYFLYGEMNYFELGIYLPNINAVLDGLIPYRDFFHLRGPLEVYVPAFFMSLFGENAAILSIYFYVGTVVTLLIGVWIAKDIYRTRFALYLMVPVFVGRTFPRVVFTNWGGMRFGLGLLAVLLAIGFLRRKKFPLLVASGVISGLALLTSVEIGVFSILSIMATCIFALCFSLYEKKIVLKMIRTYILGLALVLLPYAGYLFSTQSLVAFFDTIYSVINWQVGFSDHLFEDHPKNFIEIILAMSPFNSNFKHLTPAYCYLFFIIYIAFRIKKNTLKARHLYIVAVAFYGLMMYIAAFRKIGAAQFEMALQPEKILLFFMLEETYLWLRDRKHKIGGMIQDQMLKSKRRINQLKTFGINFLILGFIMSSLGYSVMRYDRRFFSFQYVKNILLNRDVDTLIPMSDQKMERMNLERLKGMVVPSWQAQDFRQLTEFVNQNTEPDEPVFMFPELGFYSFIIDRPFVGRFPIATFSWVDEEWHRELLKDLTKTKPRFVILPKKLDPVFDKVFFKLRNNKDHYDETMHYIIQNYQMVNQTHSLFIYSLKN